MHWFISSKNKVKADEYHNWEQGFQPKASEPPTKTARLARYLERAAERLRETKEWIFRNKTVNSKWFFSSRRCNSGYSD